MGLITLGKLDDQDQYTVSVNGSYVNVVQPQEGKIEIHLEKLSSKELEHAENTFPPGTRFIPPGKNDIFTVKGGHCQPNLPDYDDISVNVEESPLGYYLKCDDEWALKVPEFESII